MGKNKVEEVAQTKEDKHLEKETKRLLELACSRGLLSEEKAVPEKPLHPKLGIRRCDGKDICKKGHRKNKYLFSFPGLVATVAGGKFGELAQLDSRNPILYIDFPQGRLKLFGTIVYPKNKYITMNFVRGAGNIQCEDLFESMVVFPEAWWIGTKEENPDELRLEMPLDLQQEKHIAYDFAGGAGEPRDPKDDVGVLSTQSEAVQAKHMEPSKLSTPKGQLKIDQWIFQKKDSEKKPSPSWDKADYKFSSEWGSVEGDPGFVNLEDVPTPARQSARTIGKNYSYAESPVEEDGTDESGGNADLDAEPGAKTVDKFSVRKNAEYVFLDPESQAIKKNVTDMIITIDRTDDEETSIIDHYVASQTPAPRSTAPDITPVQAVVHASAARAGSKQSSLSTFFMKCSNKKKCVIVDTPVSLEEIFQGKSSATELLPYSLSESNDCKRKTSAPLEGKQTPKGAVGKGKPPAKRIKMTMEEKAIEDTQSKGQLILVSDDSDAG